MAEGGEEFQSLSQILLAKRSNSALPEPKREADMMEYPSDKKRFITYQSKPGVLKVLFEDEDTKDVSLTGYDRERFVSAHKCVLAASSPFFKKMFYGTMKETKESPVQLENFSSAIIQDVVTFLYTGRVEVEQQVFSRIYELFKAARFFDLPPLSKVCHYFLSILGEGAVRDESFLALSADNMAMLLKLHSLKCNELILFQALEKWFEVHSEISQDTVRELSGLIRYHLIPVKSLFDKVRPSKWKNEELVWEAVQNWTDPKIPLKIPSCVSRANMWTLLPFCRGTVINWGINRKGKMAFEVAAPSRYVAERDNCNVVAGFLLSLTTLEPPVRFQIFTKGDTHVATVPNSMNAIALHWSLIVDQLEKKPTSPTRIDLDSDTIPPAKLPRHSADSPSNVSNPIPEPPYFPAVPRSSHNRDIPVSSGMHPVHIPTSQGLLQPTASSSMGSPQYIVHQVDAKMSNVEISRSGKSIVIRSSNHTSTLSPSVPDAECYLQMGLQFLSHCTYANIAVC